MDKHKILNPCDILTGKVTVDELAKQFSDKITEEVTGAMNFKKNDAEKINDFTKWKTGFENFCWQHNMIPCVGNDGNIGLKDSSGYTVRTNNGMFYYERSTTNQVSASRNSIKRM